MLPVNSPGSGGVEKATTLIDVIDLAESLRQEQLFISNERSTYHRLNDTLTQHCNTVTEVCLCSTTHHHPAFIPNLTPIPAELDLCPAPAESKQLSVGPSRHWPSN